MIVSQQPAAIHTAFNPIIVKLTKEGSETHAIIKIAIGNHDVLPAVFITKTSEYFNDNATIDLSALIKRQFVDYRFTVENVITDKMLSLRYSVFDNAGALLFKSVALNAVSQIGVSPSFLSKRGQFLTRFKKLKLYPNYELNVSCLSFGHGTTHILENGESIASTTEPHFSVAVEDSISMSNSDVDIYIRNNDAEIITDNNGIPITINHDDSIRSIVVENECVPKSPFYIRWINDMGGRDYWMFTRQITNSSVQNIETFNKVIVDIENAKTATELLNVEGVDKIQVSSIQLSIIDYECLSKIPYSPRVEWWSEYLQKWLLITIDKADLSSDSTSLLKSVEYTFILPQRQLQF